MSEEKESVFEILFEQNFKTTDGHRAFRVKCRVCGWETDMRKSSAERTKNCRHRDCTGRFSKNLNWKSTKLCWIFKTMVQRCYNPNTKDYRYYGSKGIKICSDWLDNPLSFEEWSLNNGYKEGLTIDRVDGNKDYCPNNCRWITVEDNSKYKSSTRELTVDGNTYTGREWASTLNLGTNTINSMLKTYPKEDIIKFIRKRLENKTLERPHGYTWMKTYEIE